MSYQIQKFILHYEIHAEHAETWGRGGSPKFCVESLESFARTSVGISKSEAFVLTKGGFSSVSPILLP